MKTDERRFAISVRLRCGLRRTGGGPTGYLFVMLQGHSIGGYKKVVLRVVESGEVPGGLLY